MKQAEPNTAIQDVRTLFGVGAIGRLSDGELLERFIASQDAAVFELLVRRLGPMVWGVCRRVLRDFHDAEDAFQATFLVLARKAASVAPPEALPNWLYGVAYRTALKAKAMRTKQQGRENATNLLPEPEAGEAARDDDLSQILDSELSRLPEKYRVPIVMCEMEGMTYQQTAVRLGWPIGTVSGRLSRAKAMLIRRLARHGVALSAGSLALWLSQDAALGRMPLRLIAPTTRVASQFAAGSAALLSLVPSEVALLTSEVLRAMMFSRAKFVTSVLAVGILLTGGGFGLVYRALASGGPSPEPARATAAAAEESTATENMEPQDRPDEPMTSYAFRIEPDQVYELPELKVQYRDFRLESGPVSVVPITTERGITGAMIIGNGGTFRYAPEGGEPIEGQFRAAMLRFNPEEQASIVPLDKGKRVTDRAVSEMSRHMLQVVIRHCWQSSKDGGRKQEVLIPPRGTLAAVLYSKTHGDLLISFGEGTATAHNFTDRKTLYEKK